jgi:hypothetical protein
MEQQVENVKLGDEERRMLADARIITPEQVESGELTQEEYEVALEALRQKRLGEAKDAVERLETGLPNAAEVIGGLRAAQQKVHRAPNTPRVPAGDPATVAEEEWAKYEQPLTGKSAPVKRMEAVRQPQGPRLVQLDPVTVLKIELVAAKKRAATAEERIALLAIQDARKAKAEAELEEAELMKTVTRQLKIPPGKNVRLVDKEKGLCQIEG